MGCLPDQVKLTRYFNKELEEAMKDIRQLGDHGEEASQRITKLESLCKQNKEAIEKLKKENATLDGMVQSHDKLIMEIAIVIGLDQMGEDDQEDDDEDNIDDEDDDDRGDADAPPTTTPPPADATSCAVVTPELVVEEEEDPEMMVPEQEARKALEDILPEEESEPPQPNLFTIFMRDHEGSPSRMYDNLNDLDD
jgi:DNA repair exonuclease SbcCD ATPase subunit